MTDLLTELPTIDESKFRFQNQKAMLTYRTHLDKVTVWTKLAEISEKKMKKCYIAHENGHNDPITPYEHTHVVVDFGYAVQSRNARFLDIDGIHPHISKILKPDNWRRACQYITKEDKTVTIDKEDKGNIVTDIWKADTVQGALENIGNLRDALPTIAIFNLKPLELPEPNIREDQFYPWQKDMWNLLQYKPDGRKVKWIYDIPGCSGKTQFALWVCLTHPKKAVFLNNVGKISDFCMNMKSFWDKGWRGDTVFLNLSRSYTDRTQIYEAIEIILDGVATCTKYTGGQVWFPPLHVIVMSNFVPATERLSRDRWEIFDSESKELCPVTLSRGTTTI